MIYKIDEVIAQLKQRGVTAEDLYDNVSDCKNREAEIINDMGMYEQVKYLLGKGMNPEDMGVEDFSAAEKLCKKCGSEINIKGYCMDLTCPYSDWSQETDLDVIYKYGLHK